MMIKIRNWKLALLSLVLILILISLGFWQLSRAHEKASLLKNFQARGSMPPASAKDLSVLRDWRFYQLKVEGKFDEAHTFLLDNKIFNGKVGYEVYTPFKAKGVDVAILVDRGFIPLGVSRDSLPAIPKASKKEVKIQGMLNTPPLYFAFGGISENGKTQWPLRVEYINVPEIAKLLNTGLFPYVLSLDEESPGALQVKWQIATIDPNKHKGYAVQWFALALTLLIISALLNRVPPAEKGRGKKKK